MKFKSIFRPRLNINIQRSLRLRLIIAIPAVTASLTMAAGFLTLQLCRQLLEKAGIPEAAYDIMYIVMWIMALVLIAILSGILLAMGIIRPLNRLARQARNRIPGGYKPKESSDIDEISRFNSVFAQTLISLDEYISDSDILNRLPEGIISINYDGSITRANQIAANILECNPPDMIGKFYADFFSDVPGELSLCLMIKEVLQKRSSYYHKQATVRVGDKVLDLLVNLHPIQNETRAVASLLLSFRSMSEAIQMRYRIRQIDQLATIGTLSAGLAHEIRNPLGYISNLVELLQPKIASDPATSSYLDMILNGISRLNNLVEELLTYSKSSGNINRTETGLDQLLSGVIAISKNAIDNSNKVKLIEEYDPFLATINVDPEKLTQVLSNILINAYQATPDFGQVTISTELISNSSGNSLAVIGISNTGSYIPPKEIEKIFTPFFTTKSGGTGLGLPIAMQIVAAHSGSITVTSSPEEGTKFQVEIPI